ncbi:LLM class F420-dependent oxidoreductase [Actinoplanes capillaceus]|uniref:LLM class F420-dependent oxidoreductase n=1 Tax=Actinoplanes campanulatus TaxID=113559 RepID=A0ABQ3WPQ0_9ACTN|nr:TIGR03564 family F420-dependent LLM class oxidoreductase [Actinoplanes capillaceus]GID48203.1 LLM class F420-dependent oxidoreductase [Actinoplanes capillaceus]
MDISIMIGDVRGPATAADLKDQVTAADCHGVWAAQALGWDALTALVVAGAHAPGIRLGTAVVPVRQRHPLLLAGQALSVQAATGNRLTLGIGAGIGAMTGGMFGLPTGQPVRYLREYLSILLPLLRGEPVTHTGRFLTSIGTVELPATAPPPVLLAALGPAMLRLAGSSTDGAITWMTGPRTLESHVVPLIREAAPVPPRIVAGLPVCVTGDETGARSRITERFGMAGQVPEYRAVLDREGVTGPADVAIVGDEETVARAVRRLEDTGITEFAAAPFGDPAEQRRTTTLLRDLAGTRPVTRPEARRGPDGR